MSSCSSPCPKNNRPPVDVRPLRRARERLGLSQSQVARSAGIEPETICNFENVLTTQNLSTFQAVVHALNVDAFDIMEILNYWPIDKRTIISFRAACKRVKIDPARALEDFVRIFISMHGRKGDAPDEG